MSPRADRRRRCLVCAAGVLVSGLLATGTATGLAATATGAPAIVAGGESWAPELALEGGDDQDVVLADGGVRPVPVAGARAEGVLTVAPRRLLGPTDEITGTVTADLPRGTGVELQVRALDPQGAWGPWETVPGRSPARLGTTTTEVGVRLLLHGAADGSAVPTARGVWLTAVPAPTPTRTSTRTVTAEPSTTTVHDRPSRPTATSASTTPARPTTTTTAPPSSTTTTTTAGTTTPTTTTTTPCLPLPTRLPAPLPLPTVCLPAPPRAAFVAAAPTTTTPPTTPPTTTTAGPAVAAGLIWDGSIATRGLGGFKDTPYDITGDSSVKVLDGPPRTIRFTVPSGSQRAEVEPDVDEFGEGETRYFRLTYTLPTTFPATPSGFQLATQWKNDGTGSPPLELRIEDGTFRLGGGFGRPGGSRLFATDIAPVVTGRPVDIVVGIVFSSDPAKGRVDVWLDGRQRLAGFRPPGGTLYPGKDSYWKVGLYRDTGNAGTATADLGVARLGETYESVAGPVPSAPTTTASPTTSPPRTSTPSRPTSPTPTVIGTTPPSP